MIPIRLSVFSTGLAVLALSAGAYSDTITGRVIAPNGSGVANVDIDAVDSNGNDGGLTNGATDANGFFTATINSGTYDLFFKPPAPPTTTLLVGVRENVVVNGTVNLGNITLVQGVSLQGRVVNQSNVGVAAINIDVEKDNANVVLTADSTNGTGNFLLAVPTGPIEVLFDTTPVSGSLLAPFSRELNLSANHNLGTMTALPGFLVTAIVRRTNGTPVSGVDVDVFDNTTGDKQFTPGDNTDNNGFVDFVVKAGVFDIEFCAPTANRLVTLVLQDRAISATTNLGVVTMQGGVLLSGHVQSAGGSAIPKVDIDVFQSSNGAEIATCLDDTDANGNYTVVVPTGTFDIVFTPDFSTPYSSDVALNVAVNADRVVNRTLAACEGAVSSGSGTPGTGGRIPQISASGGFLRVGNPNLTINVSNARGGATAIMVMSAGSNCGGAGGSAWRPMRQIGGPTVFVLGGSQGAAGQGTGSVPAPLPDLLALVGMELYARVVVIDPGASNGFARTPALCGTFCD